jgi:maltose alpha-D-glucosyltransferase/alpha-amylase
MDICSYGAITNQLEDEHSFISKLQSMLKVRSDINLATAHQLEIPDVLEKPLLVMVHRLNNGKIQATVLNFSTKPIATNIHSYYFEPGNQATDLFKNTNIGIVGKDKELYVEVEPLGGLCLLFED